METIKQVIAGVLHTISDKMPDNQQNGFDQGFSEGSTWAKVSRPYKDANDRRLFIFKRPDPIDQPSHNRTWRWQEIEQRDLPFDGAKWLNEQLDDIHQADKATEVQVEAPSEP